MRYKSILLLVDLILLFYSEEKRISLNKKNVTIVQYNIQIKKIFGQFKIRTSNVIARVSFIPLKYCPTTYTYFSLIIIHNIFML